MTSSYKEKNYFPASSFFEMAALPTELVCEIFEYLALDDLIRMSRVSRLWYNCSRKFIWEKRRFVKKISLDESFEIEHLPVKELRTSDISDFGDGINPVSLTLLDSLVKMKKLVLDYFGKLIADELNLIFALPYKLELSSMLLFETRKYIEDEDSFLALLKKRNGKIGYCAGVQEYLWTDFFRKLVRLNVVYLKATSMCTYTSPVRWTCTFVW